MDYLIEFDYDADEDDELTIRKGDIVNNTKAHEDGWMMGVLRGKEGVFPSNFGKPLKEERRKSQEDNLISPTTDEKDSSKDEENGERNEERNVPTTKKVPLVGYGNIFSGGGIKLKPTIKSKRISGEIKPEIVFEKKPNNKPKELVKVIHSYTAENPDELTIEIGDIITVFNKDDEDEGWWKGQKANGQVGVFPDNFVEPYKVTQEEGTKVTRVNPSFNKNAPPPPVIAAKPKIGIDKIPPRPPQISDKVASSVKPIYPIVNQEKDDGVSFDDMNNHKPLVGPNAGRAKPPGKKLPTNISNKTAHDEKLKNEGDKKINTQKSNKDTSVDIDKSLTKPKSIEAHIEKHHPVENTIQSKSNSKDLTPSEKTNDNIENNDTKHKEPILSGSSTHSTEKDPELFHTKSTKNSKSSTLPKKISIEKDNDTNTAYIPKIEPDFKKNSPNLESRISDLENENSSLRNEISDLRKTSNDQINNLKNRINKLTNELDEEKTKRAANEVNLSRLKETVEDLEASILSLSHK